MSHPTAHSADAAPLTAPSLRLLALEARFGAELPLFLWRSRHLDRLPRGDGHPVMVVPGFGGDDFIMQPLREALRRLGYTVYGWEQGRNFGMRPAVKNALNDRLLRLAAHHEAPLSLIGWSLGGVFVREMARHQPQAVRRVFTMGSPFAGDPYANNMNLLFQLANRGRPVKVDQAAFLRRAKAPPVACVAMHSKSDGIVNWRCSLEETAAHTENVEVHGSHFGLAYNFEVLRALAERLPLPPLQIRAADAA